MMSVVASAMLCGALMSLTPEGSCRGLLRILCAMAMTVCILQPIAGRDFLLSMPLPDADAGAEFIAQGKKEAHEAMASIIKQRVEAYILDKAAGLGAELEVEITLTEDPVPVPETALIHGPASPSARAQLERSLETDLGITKEHQNWIG